MSDDPFGALISAAVSPDAPAQPYQGPNLGPLSSATPAPPPPAKTNDPFGAALANPPADTTQTQDKGPVPSWSEIPGQAASNFGKSAIDFGSNIAHATMHLIETGENLGSVGLGYMEKAGKNLGLPSGQGYEKYADAVNQMVLDRYGSMDNFKRTLATDPVGAAADLSAVLTGGGSLAGKLPGIAGKIGDAVNAVGRTVDPLAVPAAAVSGTIKGATGIAKHVVGERTGAGPEALSSAYEAGHAGDEAAQTFRDNIRGNVPIEDPVHTAMEAMDNIVQNKNSSYKQGMAQAGLTQPISGTSWNRIAQGIRDAGDVDKFDMIEGVAKANDDLSQIVDKFLNKDPATHHTVEGLDALKQAVGEYGKGLEGTKAGVVVSKYYQAISDAIKEQAPAYAKVMEDYGEAKSQLNQIQKSFSLPANERKLNIDTALRKLQSVMRNNVNTNYGYRTTLLKMLEDNGAPNIKYAISGQALNAKSPRGLSKVASEKGAEIAGALFGFFTGNPAIMAGALKAAGITYLTSTPRLAGEAAYYAGRVGKPLGKVFNKPNARILNQAGRIDQLPAMQARGGAVQRALRATKHQTRV